MFTSSTGTNIICRACLEKTNRAYQITGKFSESEIEIFAMLTYITSAKVHVGSGYPNEVCIQCFHSIQMAYKFLLQYNKCQEKIKETLENFQNSVAKQELDVDSDGLLLEREIDFEEKVSVENMLSNPMSIDNSHEKSVKITKKRGKAKLYSLDHLCVKAEEVDKSILTKTELFNISITENRKQTQIAKIKYYIKTACPICKQNISEFHELIQHLSQSHKDNMFCCTFCKRKGKYTTKQYIQHLTRNHVFYCTFCKKIFTSYATLYYHLKVKHAKNKNLYKCDQCDKTYPIKSLMTSHKKSHIIGEKYLCNQCGTAFQTYKTYNLHKKKHDGTWNIKKYKCEICSQTFALRFGLRRHMFKHSKEDNFLCNKCGKGFRTYDTYNYHRKTHDNTRNHKCNVCGQAFLQAVHLKDHMERHTRMKCYRCEICDKEYSGAGSLRKHRRIYHASTKPENNQNI